MPDNSQLIKYETYDILSHLLTCDYIIMCIQLINRVKNNRHTLKGYAFSICAKLIQHSYILIKCKKKIPSTINTRCIITIFVLKMYCLGRRLHTPNLKKTNQTLRS